MFYERSFSIERRLTALLALIRQGRYATPQLALRLGVSIPTVSRDVTALRERGHQIRSEKAARGWRYTLIRQSTSRQLNRAGIASAGSMTTAILSATAVERMGQR
ncbi:MAG TPA: HTH domain-containing protein [Lacipirellulaceae bacterium]|nr:HTH domain-containing protein [Lacipirellulaceae bacterium]